MHLHSNKTRIIVFSKTLRMDTFTCEIILTFGKIPAFIVMWLFGITTACLLKKGEQEEERIGGLPGERRPEEAWLGGETVKCSHQMCRHVMISPGFSRVRELTGKLSLLLSSAGLFISYSRALDESSTLLIWSLHKRKPVHWHKTMWYSIGAIENKPPFRACCLSDSTPWFRCLWRFVVHLTILGRKQ